MCGRLACTLDPDQLSCKCLYKKRDGSSTTPLWSKNKDKFTPGFNKAPQSYCPVLVQSQLDGDGEILVGDRSLAAMKWGLIPSWFSGKKEDRVGYNMNNARSDTLLQKRSYIIPLRKGQRCVVVADGFYEWKKMENGKQPYFIYLSRQDNEKEKDSCKLLRMAGIYEKTNCDDGEVYSFSVITVDASSEFSSIHHRMPAILASDHEVDLWLDYENVPLDDALALIKPKNVLRWYTVSKFVNNSRNEGEECMKKVDVDSNALKSGTGCKMMKQWLQSVAPLEQNRSDNMLRVNSSKGKKHKTATLDKWVTKKKIKD